MNITIPSYNEVLLNDSISKCICETNEIYRILSDRILGILFFAIICFGLLNYVQDKKQYHYLRIIFVFLFFTAFILSINIKIHTETIFYPYLIILMFSIFAMMFYLSKEINYIFK